MRIRRGICMLLVCATIMSCLCMTAGAVETVDQEWPITIARASGRFNMDIPGNTIVRASTSFPLEVGEVVTITASYSPFSASVNFGVIAPDGLFYSVNTKSGSINKKIEVSQRGNYTFAVRNNSSETINISGYVNY